MLFITYQCFFLQVETLVSKYMVGTIWLIYSVWRGLSLWATNPGTWVNSYMYINIYDARRMEYIYTTAACNLTDIDALAKTCCIYNSSIVSSLTSQLRHQHFGEDMTYMTYTLNILCTFCTIWELSIAKERQIRKLTRTSLLFGIKNYIINFHWSRYSKLNWDVL